MFMRALTGREKVLGKGHPETLGTLGTLAELMQEQVLMGKGTRQDGYLFEGLSTLV